MALCSTAARFDMDRAPRCGRVGLGRTHAAPSRIREHGRTAGSFTPRAGLFPPLASSLGTSRDQPDHAKDAPSSPGVIRSGGAWPCASTETMILSSEGLDVSRSCWSRKYSSLLDRHSFPRPTSAVPAPTPVLHSARNWPAACGRMTPLLVPPANAGGLEGTWRAGFSSASMQGLVIHAGQKV